MLGRLVLRLVALATGAALLTPVAPARAAGLFVVPEGVLSGSVIVTANLPTESAPYLRVQLRREHSSLSASTPVQPNLGPGTEVEVETWGLSGSTEFQIDGCLTPTPSSCTDVESVLRTVSQTELATATIDVPAAEVFAYPEEQVIVDASNDGGGVLEIQVLTSSSIRRQPLTAGVPTAVDLSGMTATSGTVRIHRCSSYDLWVCEVLADSRIRFLADVRAALIVSEDRPLISLPQYAGALIRVDDLVPKDVDLTVSWTLENSGGTTVHGPVITQFEPNSVGSVSLYIDPAAYAGAPFPDGDYTLRVRNTAHVGDVARSAEVTHQLTFLADPPFDLTTPVVSPSSVDREVRGDEAFPAVTWEASIPAAARSYVLEVRDAQGQLVHVQKEYSCGCEQPPVIVSWDGTGWPDGTQVDPGHYSARLTVLDVYGRGITVPLGEVRIWATPVDVGPQPLRTAERSVIVRARPARVSTGRFVGRCSSIVRGRDAGVLSLRSATKCWPRKHRATEVVQRFRIYVPPMAGARISDVDVAVETMGTGQQQRASQRTRHHEFHSRISFPSAGRVWSPLQRQSVRRGAREWTRVGHWAWDQPTATQTQDELVRGGIDVEIRVSRGYRVDVRAVRATVTYTYAAP